MYTDEATVLPVDTTRTAVLWSPCWIRTRVACHGSQPLSELENDPLKTRLRSPLQANRTTAIAATAAMTPTEIPSLISRRLGNTSFTIRVLQT